MINRPNEMSKVDLLESVVNERDRLYDARFKSGETAIAAALAAQKEAVLKAEAATERRFESVNEFRQLVNDLIVRLISRIEVEDKLKSFTDADERITERLSVIEKSNANTEGRFWAIGVGFTILSALISIALHFLGK